MDMMDIIVGKNLKVTEDKLTLDIEKKQDKKARLEDDFFKNINGAWIRDAVIPGDSTSVGGFEIYKKKHQKS